MVKAEVMGLPERGGYSKSFCTKATETPTMQDRVTNHVYRGSFLYTEAPASCPEMTDI